MRVEGSSKNAVRLPGYWLAMDTSTTAMTIALSKDDELIGESLSRSERNHSIRLVPAVQELLADNGLKAAELDGVAVGRGPGSYTGIRIAVTVAKTLAWQLKLPLIGISSLEALAYGAARRWNVENGVKDAAGSSGRLWMVPFMDARRGKAYSGLYELHNGVWTVLEADGIRPMESWLTTVRELAKKSGDDRVRRVILAGDGEGFAAVLEGVCERGGTIIPSVQDEVPQGPGRTIIPSVQDEVLQVELDQEPLQAAYVGMLAKCCGLAGAAVDVHGFEPNYTQLSEPEKKLYANKQG